jgi:microcystin-dependent protein
LFRREVETARRTHREESAMSSEPYIGEIDIFAFSFPPRGWALCNGQLLSISQNQALFAILGVTYGGNGTTNFALPNLQGRVPIHFGSAFALGVKGGEEGHALAIGEIPQHVHQMRAKAAQADLDATGRRPSATVTPAQAATNTAANPTAVNIYGGGPAGQALDPNALANTGASQAHENRQPFLTLSICIALQGIFPSRN